VLGGKREQSVVEVVAREDRERALRAKPAIEQRLADPAHAREGLRVGQPPPGAVRPAFGEERARRRMLGPMLQTLRKARGVRPKRMRRARADRAVLALLQHQIERSQTHLAHARRQAASCLAPVFINAR
jgi:hypothetical protein